MKFHLKDYPRIKPLRQNIVTKVPINLREKADHKGNHNLCCTDLCLEIYVLLVVTLFTVMVSLVFGALADFYNYHGHFSNNINPKLISS